MPNRCSSSLACLDIFEGEIQAASDRILPILPEVTDNDAKASLYKNLGWAYLTQNRYAAAEENLRESLTLESNEPTTHFLLAQVLEARGKAKKALESWSNGLECIPRDRQFGVAWQPPELSVWCVLAYQRSASRAIAADPSNRSNYRSVAALQYPHKA